MEFKEFSKIERLTRIQFVITQKIHGSNAQIFITPKFKDMRLEEPRTLDNGMIDFNEQVPDGFEIRAGSRNRWLHPSDDNYGFAAYVEANKDEIIRILGPGRHYGEWAGPGINSGEGLTQKTLILFDWWKHPPQKVLPPQMVAVPVLYNGEPDFTQIEKAMTDLQLNGSKLVPGFMRPEGIVVTVAGTRYKKVFDPETTKWKDPSKAKVPKDPNAVVPDYSHLLQPIRLEKLLSKDERYAREFPNTLPEVVKAYVADLIAEGEIVGDEDLVKAITKGASGQIFRFVKTVMETVQ